MLTSLPSLHADITTFTSCCYTYTLHHHHFMTRLSEFTSNFPDSEMTLQHVVALLSVCGTPVPHSSPSHPWQVKDTPSPPPLAAARVAEADNQSSAFTARLRIADALPGQKYITVVNKKRSPTHVPGYIRAGSGEGGGGWGG
ncbi:hypothetical protein Pmani_037773 [Petrolisthes manimaculis]|uniref:Uncharacterized protein n=1 Tax=Petrolisthes manimaculis TaxID=1843537 RepID=A0AAE1NH55_9EUCA|nr:hypothetical protein Pmani_037773 [Petrolisthes manimaculis]